jgi:hypothetical protein
MKDRKCSVDEKPDLKRKSTSFKDVMGRYRTQSLFREFYVKGEGLEPVWTLREEDPQGKLPSLKALYLEIGDPTEYRFAIEAFGSWKQWLKIKASKTIEPWIEDWPIELEVKIRSNGIQGVMQEAKVGKSKFPAAKALAEGFWNKEASKRGRPSKEEVTRERKIAAKLDEEFIADAERIGLQVINGGISDD